MEVDVEEIPFVYNFTIFSRKNGHPESQLVLFYHLSIYLLFIGRRAEEEGAKGRGGRRSGLGWRGGGVHVEHYGRITLNLKKIRIL